VERRQLEYFLAVVEHGGVTRASAYLHVSQPAISAAIGKLEAELGGLLFERIPGGVILTSAGRALVEPANQVVRDFAVAAETVRDTLGLRGGRLDICAVPAISAGWLPPAIAAFRLAHPQIDIVVRSETDGRLIADGVRSGRDNLGLTVSAGSETGLVTRQVGEQELQAIFPPGAEQAGMPIALEELVDRDLVTWDRSTARRWFEAELGRRGVRVPTPIELGSIDGVLPLVSEGIGYALWWTPMSSSMVGECVLRPIRPGYRRPIFLVLRTGPLPPATNAFLTAAGIQPGFAPA
jgi:LysR family transcriptional regulator, carnitine catabolism transcriptional activator